ncbi:MAG: DUF4249 family protein, partial [Chitinophagaceae bacterium]|nr:DUF4249 family protein [Chitinophagaceae bacterium]
MLTDGMPGLLYLCVHYRFFMKQALTFFRWGLLGMFLLILASCEKTIDVGLTEGEKQLVVEGVIESGQAPYVVLTRSIGFFDKIDLSKVDFVKGAQLRVDDLANPKLKLYFGE